MNSRRPWRGIRAELLDKQREVLAMQPGPVILAVPAEPVQRLAGPDGLRLATAITADIAHSSGTLPRRCRDDRLRPDRDAAGH